MITDSHIQEICKIIHKHYGVVIQEHQVAPLRQYLDKIILSKQYQSIDEYIRLLYQINYADDLSKALVEAITVDESYFFRHRDHLAFLMHDFFPRLINERRCADQLYLRIWSAGCASGQEVYTMLMLLDQLIPDKEQWEIYILGTDINYEAIARARAAIYGGHSFRAINPIHKKTYFSEYGERGDYKLTNKISKLARFEYLNLISDDYHRFIPDIGFFDLVLCRNVFIYLDYPTVMDVVQKIRACLATDGVLLLGPSDIINNNIPGVEAKEYQGVIYYQRVAKQKIKEEDAELTFREKLESKSREAQYKKVEKPAPVIDKTEITSKIESAITAEDWQLAVNIANKNLKIINSDAFLLQCYARALASLGQYEKAEKVIDDSIKLYDLDAKSHYVRGLIFHGKKETDEALSSFKRAIFLDPDFVEAYYHMALIYLMQSKRDQGLNMIKKTIKISESLDMARNIFDDPHVTIKEFTDGLKNDFSLQDRK